MKRIHSRDYTVRNYELGPHQAAHVRILLDYLQETADSHSPESGSCFLVNKVGDALVYFSLGSHS